MQEARREFGGTRTRVLELAGEGRPLLLLHGYSDSADTWRPLLGELAAAGRRALAVDLPGFGRADRLAPGAVLPQLDRFVAAVLEEHPDAIVVGNSLGGVAGLRAAQDASLPLAGVVAISPAGLGHARWVDLMEREPVVHRLARAPIPIPIGLLRRGIAFAYARLAVARRIDPEIGRRYASHYADARAVRRIVGDARTLLGEIASAYELDRITRPVLLVWGERDFLVPSTGAHRVLDAVPGSRLVVLPRTGHCAQLEEPAEVARLLADFDARLDQERAA